MQFKQIEGYSNYIVFENGNIQNINSGKIIKPFTSNNGYLRIQLSENGNPKKYFIHNLVAQAFLGNKPENYQTDHIDRNKLNNHYTNLRYISQSDNCKNRNSYNNIEAVYLDKISENCFELTEYNNHKLENIYMCPYTYQLYQFNGIQYRELRLLENKGRVYYYVQQGINKSVKISLSVLKNEFKGL
ncbi:Conserved_hypothetical protein [Hexamita inflata]|uniref:HNH homing endonuclease n=1 Tax=Hexamita inflata TaxID=28002 RepID=A0ABP1I811_9EUKA